MKLHSNLIGSVAVLGGAASVLLVGPGAVGQERIWYAESNVKGDLFGGSIAIAPDSTGDGIPELLISAPSATCNNPGDGYVSLFSTGAGGELARWCGDQESLGTAVDSIADVDGGGLDDILVGGYRYRSPTMGSNAGRVLVISTESETVILEVVGEAPDIQFGSRVNALPDLDGDGFAEFLAGMPGFDTSGAGLARVHSSKDGSILRIDGGEGADDRFGINTEALEDVDGDGVADYAVSAQLDWLNDDSVGRIYVYSGDSGALIRTWSGTEQQEVLGLFMAPASDLDGDGLADLLAYSADPSTGGKVSARSPATGNLIWTIEGEGYKFEQFGYAMTMVGDLNSDGYEEFAVGAPGDDHDGVAQSGRVTLFSGRTLRPLYRFYPGYQTANFGSQLASGSDFDGDGLNDLVVSAPATRNSKPKGGRVSIFAGNDLYLQAEPTDPVPDEVVTVEIRGGEPGALAAMVLVDVNGTPTFTPLVVDLLDANGELSMTGCAPDDGSGLSVTLIGYAQKLSGKPKLIDTSHETITVQ